RLEDGPGAGNWGLVESLAARRSGHRKAVEIIPGLLRSPDAELRRMALQWIAEERLTQFADQMPQALKAGPVTRDGLEAALAWRGDDPSEAALREIAGDENRDADWRHEATAGLAASAASSPQTKRLLLDLLHDGPPDLRSEALRSLRGLVDKSEAERLMPDL